MSLISSQYNSVRDIMEVAVKLLAYSGSGAMAYYVWQVT